MGRYVMLSLLLITFYDLEAQKNDYAKKIELLTDKANQYLYIQQDSSYHYYDKIVALATSQKDWKNVIEGLINTNRAASYFYDLGRVKSNLLVLDSLFVIHKQYLDSLPDNLLYKNSLLYDKGNYHFNLKNFEKSRNHFGKIISTTKVIPDSVLSMNHIYLLSVAYIFIAKMYSEEGKYDLAKQYYNNNIRYISKHTPEDKRSIYSTYTLLAEVYEREELYKRSNTYFLKVLNYIKNNKTKNTFISVSLNIAKNHISLSQMDSAAYYLTMAKNNLGTNHIFWNNYYDIKARLYQNDNKVKEATEMYHKSLALLRQKHKYAKHPDIAKIYNKIGQLYESQNNIEKALENYQQALQQLSVNFNSDNLKDNPSVKNSKGKSILLGTLKNKSGALNKSANFLNSLLSVDQAIVALDSLKPTFESEGDKQLLIENAFPLFESGIEAAYQLYKSTDNKKYIDQAFFYSEKGKSVVLLEAILKTRANTFAKIPSEILEKEKQLKSLITYLEKRLRRKENTDLEEQLFDARSEYRQLIKTIETKYKKYYDLKYNTRMATVVMIQNHLKSDEALISYFYGDQAIYSIVIRNDTKEFHKIALDDNLRIRIKTVHQMLGNPKSDVVKLALLTNELYDSLLAPSLQHKKYNKLTIIADGLLNYIPFGSLNTTKTKIQYLIENYSISYASSATLLLRLKAKNISNNEILGFAPSFDNHKKAAVPLLPLPNNRNELQQILLYFEGKSFVENNASLQNFNTEISNYGIIHLATHAVVNDNAPEYSYLAFSPKEEDYLLYVSDIYNLELNANLVTLSACESGIGDLRRGEGMISLSRGFFYSGAASIVNTMWKINDASSSQIMGDFYKHLADGESKEVALQNAKLDFLKENKQNPLTHPYFWSGFVISGDTTPLVKKNPVWIWLIGALLVMVVLGIFLFRRRKPKTLIQNPQ